MPWADGTDCSPGKVSVTRDLVLNDELLFFSLKDFNTQVFHTLLYNQQLRFVYCHFRDSFCSQFFSSLYNLSQMSIKAKAEP